MGRHLAGGENLTIGSSATITSKSVVFVDGNSGGKLSQPISGVVAMEFCGVVNASGEQAIFSISRVGTPLNIYQDFWWYRSTLGAGHNKKGYLVTINMGATIYADCTDAQSVSSFVAKALNGVVKTLDGVGGLYNAAHTIGFSFRREFPFIGEAFCVRLYNRALSAAEVAENYAIDKARFGLT